jgi:hypothetical protein
MQAGTSEHVHVQLGVHIYPADYLSGQNGSGLQALRNGALSWHDNIVNSD